MPEPTCLCIAGSLPCQAAYHSVHLVAASHLLEVVVGTHARKELLDGGQLLSHWPAH